MVRLRVLAGVCGALLAALSFTTLVTARQAADTRLVEAAMRGDRTQVAALIKARADVNAAQGDGMTALHWAAEKNDVEMARALVAAGAAPNAKTRLAGYTPLYMASRNGNATMIALLLAAGADAQVATTTGTSPLMLAAASGSADAVALLIDRGANVNAREFQMGQTPLMFAAANNRVDAIKTLVARGADVRLETRVVNVPAQQAADRAAQGARGGGRGRGAAPAGPGQPATGQAQLGSGGQGASSQQTAAAANPATGQAARGGAGAPGDPAAAQPGAARGRRGGAAGADGQGGNNNGDDSRPAVIDFQGGLTSLMYAARQGHMDAVRSLLDAGADVNQVSPGDKTSPLLIATVNGRFDVAMYLLERGADPNLASTANATPLYGALNVQWAPHAFYPQPSTRQEKTTHLELMKALLERGAKPDVQLSKKLWYTGYNFDQSGVDATGSSPFWRAAQATDVAAMKLLIAHGADPKLLSAAGNVRLPNGRTSEDGTTPGGAPAPPPTKSVNGVSALHMATGAGYDGNFQVTAPGGWMAAVKYLVEELGFDVNEADYRGYTPLHNAAFRGDNEMIKYLVSKGADPLAVTKDGQTTVDLANGPVQRLQPFPETIKLLESMGAKNNHKCRSC